MSIFRFACGMCSMLFVALSSTSIVLAAPANPGVEAFFESGTWQAPKGATTVQIEMWAAGGGAGGGETHGGSGGWGEFVKHRIRVKPGQIYTVTVGIGGLKGVLPTDTGSDGTDSEFKSIDGSLLLSADGGKGGGPANAFVGAFGQGGIGGGFRVASNDRSLGNASSYPLYGVISAQGGDGSMPRYPGSDGFVFLSW
ncbi:MAG: glycine-rich domain-containing protein [Candidatus Sumerlaeaceae bacterium]